MIRLLKKSYTKKDLKFLLHAVDVGLNETLDQCQKNCPECPVKNSCKDLYNLQVFIRKQIQSTKM